ncbi:MAG: hypothetical protein SFW09_08790 [Hyphomicrobiaceae bacterium]|nr:hypothetical protein [Hyphomicrobiaceae bacterium]
MKADFHESLEDSAVALPSDRSTGLVLATAGAVAAVIWWQSMPAVAATGLAVAVVLGGLSLGVPHVLRPLNVAWMALGQLMGRIVSPVVMLAMFAIAIVPFGIAMQLRSDPLRRRPDLSDKTYWIVPEIKFGPADMTRQF